MIVNRPLNAEERARSQKNYNIFNVLNGLSYMCLGEAIVVLFAIRLGCPDYIVALIGAQQYFGFILLPLGKIATAHIGAARSQSVFWFARNFASALVASAALAALFCSSWAVTMIIMTGAFLFYGFRAAGVVMSQPLVGEICTEEDRSKVIGMANTYFYIACLVMLIVIICILEYNPGVWTLAGIIIVGSAMGLNASRFLARIDESESLRQSARKKMIPEMISAFKNSMLRRLLFAGLSANTMVLMLAAASMLILKRGCGVSDTNALLFSFVQFAASALFSFVCGKIAGKVGPRKVIIGVCIAELMIPVLWILAPQEGIAMRIFAFAAFAVLGAASISLSNSQAHYFLQSVPAGSRVVGSMLSAMIMSVLAGIAGMLLAGFILGHIVTGSPETAMMEYKTYFMIVFFISIPGVLLQLWLKPLPIELRKPIARGIPRENHK